MGHMSAKLFLEKAARVNFKIIISQIKNSKLSLFLTQKLFFHKLKIKNWVSFQLEKYSFSN